MILGYFPTLIIQLVMANCMHRSWGQKKGFKNAFFQKNYKAESFIIWYKTSATGLWTKLIRGQKCLQPGGCQYYIDLYCEIIFIRLRFNFMFFMGRAIHEFQIPTEYLLTLVTLRII